MRRNSNPNQLFSSSAGKAAHQSEEEITKIFSSTEYSRDELDSLQEKLNLIKHEQTSPLIKLIGIVRSLDDFKKSNLDPADKEREINKKTKEYNEFAEKNPSVKNSELFNKAKDYCDKFIDKMDKGFKP